MDAIAAAVTFEVGQGVSFWRGADGLGQVEDLHRTRVSVLYKREGRLCRARVAARRLAVWQDTRPLLFPVFNPFGRGILTPPRRKAFATREGGRPCRSGVSA